MNILATNDDGVYADGLWAAVSELQHVGDVTVVAPDRDQSGTGTSVTLSRPLRMNEVRSQTDGIKAYSVEGTPADSVILGLRSAIKDRVDLVVSGINEGPNLGNDAFISGTVGAALQGYFYGIPAIAVSVAAFEGIYFDIAARLVGLLARAFDNGVLPKKLLLNVNVPNLHSEEIKGIEITELGQRSYTDKISPGYDGKRQYYWIVRGVPEWSVSQGSDIWALEQNKISITPFLNSLDSSVDGFFKGLAGELFSNR